MFGGLSKDSGVEFHFGAIHLRARSTQNPRNLSCLNHGVLL